MVYFNDLTCQDFSSRELSHGLDCVYVENIPGVQVK